MLRKLRRAAALLIALTLTGTGARAQVFINQEKPSDWESRELLRVTVAGFVYNDAFLVECGGQTMIIDGGVKKYRHRFMDYLRSRDLTHVNYIFNTHPHDDHLQGTYINVKLEGLRADEFLSLFPEDYGLDVQKKAMVALKETGVPYHQIEPGTVIPLGGAEFTVWQWTEGNDANERSGVAMLRYKDATMLFGADLPGAGQHWFTDQYGPDLKADILKVPHHAIVPMVPEFLEAVSPDFAIITSRASATKKTNKQLESAGIPYMHANTYSIVLETNGTDWYVDSVEGLI